MFHFTSSNLKTYSSWGLVSTIYNTKLENIQKIQMNFVSNIWWGWVVKKKKKKTICSCVKNSLSAQQVQKKGSIPELTENCQLRKKKNQRLLCCSQQKSAETAPKNGSVLIDIICCGILLLFIFFLFDTYHCRTKNLRCSVVIVFVVVVVAKEKTSLIPIIWYCTTQTCTIPTVSMSSITNTVESHDLCQQLDS